MGRGDEGTAWDEERLVESTHMFTKGKQNNEKKSHACVLLRWMDIDRSIDQHKQELWN